MNNDIENLPNGDFKVMPVNNEQIPAPLMEKMQSKMFDHLVGNTKVWVIERKVNGVFHFLNEIGDNGTAYWSKKFGRAKTYQQEAHVRTAWESIGHRGRPIQYKLADIMASRQVASKKD